MTRGPPVWYSLSVEEAVTQAIELQLFSAHIVALPRKTLVMGAGAWSPSQLCWIKATMTKKVFYSSYLVSFYSCAWSFRSFQVFAYHIKHMYADFVKNSSMAKASLNSKEHSEDCCWNGWKAGKGEMADVVVRVHAQLHYCCACYMLPSTVTTVQFALRRSSRCTWESER